MELGENLTLSYDGSMDRGSIGTFDKKFDGLDLYIESDCDDVELIVKDLSEGSRASYCLRAKTKGSIYIGGIEELAKNSKYSISATISSNKLSLDIAGLFGASFHFVV